MASRRPKGCALDDFASHDVRTVAELAAEAGESKTVQVRMYGVFLLSHLAAGGGQALHAPRGVASRDGGWRVQEILAKSFDRYCRDMSYEHALPMIDECRGPDPAPGA